MQARGFNKIFSFLRFEYKSKTIVSKLILLKKNQVHLNKLLAFEKLKMSQKLERKWVYEDKFQIIFRQQKFLKKLKHKILSEEAQRKKEGLAIWKEIYF